MFDFFRRKKNEIKPMAEDVGLQRVRGDVLKIVEILHGSMCLSSMSWSELLLRFKRVMGIPEDEAVQRLIEALNLLRKGQGIGWGGIGSDIIFTRSKPIVVIV